MKHSRTIGTTLVAATAAGALSLSAFAGASPQEQRASYKGKSVTKSQLVSLQKAGKAQAIVYTDTPGKVVTLAFDTEKQVDSWLRAQASPIPDPTRRGGRVTITPGLKPGEHQQNATCSSAVIGSGLKIFADFDCNGAAINMAVNQTVANLGTFGFNDVASSFKSKSGCQPQTIRFYPHAGPAGIPTTFLRTSTAALWRDFSGPWASINNQASAVSSAGC